MSARRVVIFVVISTVVFVLTYAYILLPLDLGLGLAEGYRRLWPISFGIATTGVWLGLVLLVWRGISGRLAKVPSVARAIWLAGLGTAISLLSSYPLVVLYMYVSLDSVMATGQIGVSKVLGAAYWLLLVLSVLVLVAAPVVLVVSSRGQQDRSWPE